MIAQLRAIAWLQVRLVKHSATRDFRWLGAAAWTIQLLLALFGCGALFVVATTAGFLAFNGENAWILMIVLDGAVFLLLLVRLIMLLVELNESDFIDTGKLLFLPIRLRTLFFINFFVRNFTGLLLISLPPLIGMCCALSIMHGPQMLLGIPLGLVAVFTIATVFDALREWLLTFGASKTRLLVNVSVVIFSLLLGALGVGGAVASIFSEAEGPKGVSQEKLAEHGEADANAGNEEPIEQQVKSVLVKANTWLPLGWLPLGLYRLTDHDYRIAVFGTFGLFCIGAIGIAIDYRFVLKRYRAPSGGSDSGKKKKVKPVSKWTRLNLSLLDGRRSAYAGLTCLTRSRNFTVRSSTWFYVFAAVIACAVPFIVDMSYAQSHRLSDVTPFAGVVPILFFSIALSNNIFGQDRSGFQVLVLMPVARHTYLMGKNAVNTLIVFAWAALLVVPCIVIFRPHPAAVAAALLMAVQTQLALSIIGNGLSIAFPFRLKNGPLDQPAQPFAAMLPGFLLLILTPLVFGPIMFTAGFGVFAGWVWKIDGAWISLTVASLFLTSTACAYAASVFPMAAFLERREMRMLEVLASDRQ